MRGTLLRFLETLPPETLSVTSPEYGRGSVLSTLTHVADCHGGWTVNRPLEAPWEFAEAADDLPALGERFGRLDALVERALVCPRMGCPVRRSSAWAWRATRGRSRRAGCSCTPWPHEFRHKGQVVTLLRKLGRPVMVDLDLPPPGGW